MQVQPENSQSKAYDVAVDHGSLQASDMGRAGRAYAVQLTGPIDSRWLESCRLLRAELPCFSRFYLQGTKKTVLFACRASDLPADLSEVLEMLDDFVELANRHASSAASLPESL